MIAVIDYGAGNLFSVQNALNFLGIKNIITSDKEKIEKADKLILPGVGAFPDAMKKLEESGLVEAIKEQVRKKKPLLGICLGMQLLFEKSFEFGETEGLGFIKGYIDIMKPKNLVIPHMGWNELEKNTPCSLTENLYGGEYVYFVHSYAACCNQENVAAYTYYGGKIPAIVLSDKEYKVYGCQFHPEKSGETGASILKSFYEII